MPPHLHFNVTYLFEAQESDALRHAPGENAGVAWIAVDGLLEKVSEEGVIPVYRRIMDKVRALPR